MDWSEVAKRESIYLNFGGYGDCHPNKNYENYIAIDLIRNGKYAVAHDLSTAIPLEDNSVDGILSEHFFEHIDQMTISALLAESYRILKPGKLMRIAVPDYHSPRNLKYLEMGHDPTHTDHVTFTNFPLLKEIMDKSPFGKVKFYQYWDGDNFLYEKIDYSKGMVKRTADNDKRNFRKTLSARLIGVFRDLAFLISKGFAVTKNELLVQRGHPLRMTSIVVDLIK